MTDSHAHNIEERALDAKAFLVAREVFRDKGWLLEDPTGDPSRAGVVYSARRIGSATSEERQQAASLGSLHRAIDSANDRAARSKSAESAVPIQTGLLPG